MLARRTKQNKWLNCRVASRAPVDRPASDTVCRLTVAHSRDEQVDGLEQLAVVEHVEHVAGFRVRGDPLQLRLLHPLADTQRQDGDPRLPGQAALLEPKAGDNSKVKQGQARSHHGRKGQMMSNKFRQGQTRSDKVRQGQTM